MDDKKNIGNINLLEERSDQVREILGKTPNWMIRWGITIVFAVIFLLIFGAALISYNDIIPAKIVITSKNPPIYLKARTSGRLTRVMVKQNHSVSEGAVLAEIENTADFEDVHFLQKQLALDNELIVSIDSLRTKFPTNLSIGEMQSSYGRFLIAYQNLILFKTLAPNTKQSRLLRNQVAQEQKYLINQQRQLELFEESLRFSQNNYERNKKLYEKGVISKAEFESVSRAYLNDQQNFEQIKTNIFGTQIAMNEFASSLAQTNIEGTESENAYKQALENAKQSLLIGLFSWGQTYLIKSPIKGKVTVFDIWDQYQNVEVGEVLFTVVPEETNGMIGRVTLPIRNSGKVKEGQKVIIKLDNYPFEEWGSLSGEIQSISEVPKQGEETFYTLYIKINGLKTSFRKQIEFKQEMAGTADIVVEELTVLQRIFYELRKIFSRET